MSQLAPRYTEEHIRSLDWREHIRTRPGMYIGKLGDGSNPDDGIYVLLKEVVDNSIDEFLMGAGRRIEVSIENGQSVVVRDFGRGIPLGKVVECVSQINTGAKYDEEAFSRTVGLNGVGTKAVNALSSAFRVESFRDGKCCRAEFTRGELLEEQTTSAKGATGTRIRFCPDEEVFSGFRFDRQLVEERLWNYAFLNRGLKIDFDGQVISSSNGLGDLLDKEVGENGRYAHIHVVSDDIEFALTHTDSYGESYLSFVNGQYTPDGGTHQSAFREGILRGLKEFYNGDVDAADTRGGLVATILVRVHEPVFESQTKTKLGSSVVREGGPSLRSWVVDFVRDALVTHLHKQPEVADEILRKIRQNERERKELAGIKKLARERQKKARLHNKKLRDCKSHYDDPASGRHDQTQLFITEGDSASGSLTKARDVITQAVFALKGKPLNCFGLSKKIVYENEELNLLQHALGIEEGLEGLRYNQVILATDADVDGMHIRLLLLTFFLQFFPELVRKGHVYILQTPLFRVRNKKETHYCYSEADKLEASRRLRGNPEITRFKGLGEISPREFGQFIGESMRLERVEIPQGMQIRDVLRYFMGKNTPERRRFITSNLIAEPVDIVEEPAP